MISGPYGGVARRSDPSRCDDARNDARGRGDAGCDDVMPPAIGCMSLMFASDVLAQSSCTIYGVDGRGLALSRQSGASDRVGAFRSGSVRPGFQKGNLRSPCLLRFEAYRSRLPTHALIPLPHPVRDDVRSGPAQNTGNADAIDAVRSLQRHATMIERCA